MGAERDTCDQSVLSSLLKVCARRIAARCCIVLHVSLDQAYTELIRGRHFVSGMNILSRTCLFLTSSIKHMYRDVYRDAG